MTVENYRGFLENLQYIQQMYYAFRKKKTNGRRTYAQKIFQFERSSMALRIIAELDNKLYHYQVKTGILENCSIELYRESRKAYVKVFDELSTIDSNGIKGIKDLDMSGTYGSPIRSKAAREVPSRFTNRVKPSAPKEEYLKPIDSLTFHPMTYDRNY